MSLHESTFAYLKPTDAQQEVMSQLRVNFLAFVDVVDTLLPEGPDKTFVLRQLRDCAMWCTVTIMRNPDGSPRG
jgi:hypothetical protein